MCMFVHCLTVLQVDVQYMKCIVLLCIVCYLCWIKHAWKHLNGVTISKHTLADE